MSTIVEDAIIEEPPFTDNPFEYLKVYKGPTPILLHMGDSLRKGKSARFFISLPSIDFRFENNAPARGAEVLISHPQLFRKVFLYGLLHEHTTTATYLTFREDPRENNVASVRPFETQREKQIYQQEEEPYDIVLPFETKSGFRDFTLDLSLSDLITNTNSAGIIHEGTPQEDRDRISFIYETFGRAIEGNQTDSSNLRFETLLPEHRKTFFMNYGGLIKRRN